MTDDQGCVEPGLDKCSTCDPKGTFALSTRAECSGSGATVTQAAEGRLSIRPKQTPVDCCVPWPP